MATIIQPNKGWTNFVIPGQLDWETLAKIVTQYSCEIQISETAESVDVNIKPWESYHSQAPFNFNNSFKPPSDKETTKD